MPRALLLSTTIVAAFQLHSAAAATFVTEAPLSPAVVATAERLEIAPAVDRGRFLFDLIPLLYPTPEAKPDLESARDVAARRGIGPAPPTITVPVALTPEIWSRAIFRRNVPLSELVPAILRDAQAAYVARGLAGVDDDTLAWLSEHPDLLRFLYERGARVLAGFGEVLKVHDGRFVAPYGEAAAPLWESALGAPLTEPERVVHVLFGEHSGRLAYLMSVIAAAAPPQARFALGLWQEPRVIIERFKALASGCITSYGEWHVEERPFSRPLADLATLLVRLQADDDGAPRQPDARAIWRQAFGGGELLGRASPGPRIDAAWLVEETGGLDMYARVDRLEQFAFGQRVFQEPVSSPEALQAILKSFPNRRMLLIALERMGLHAPPVYSAALAAADALDGIGTGRRFWAFAQYQGALALLVRMQRVGTIDSRAAASLVESLSAIRPVNGDYGAQTLAWIRESLGSRLPPGSSWEDRLIAGLSGREEPQQTPRILWEGQQYRFNAALAERRRMEAVRRKQGGHTVDMAMTLDAVAGSLRQERLSLDAVRSAEATLDAMVVESSPRLRRPAVNLLPPAVSMPRDGLQWINAVRGDLQRIDRPGDLRNAARVGNSLVPFIDVVLGNALISINYAAEIGPPDGAALLAGNVALRHDFGLGRRQADLQARQPWMLPRQDFLPGVPWHVSGSLLGLDVALASLQIRRLNIDRVADAPRLTSVEREALAVNVVLLNPRRQADADLSAIADAVARGRAAVQAAIGDPSRFASVTAPLRLDGWRARSLMWAATNEPRTVATQLTLADFITIDGGVPREVLDRWGLSGLYPYACVCPRFVGSAEARVLEGRYQLPIVAATMGDLTLAVAVMLHDLHLPAVLARPVLAVGMPDFIDSVPAANGGVWWGVAREAQSLRRQRIEDYVSAAAAVDGPLIPDDPDSHED